MAIYQYGNHVPQIHPSAYIAPESVIIGRVIIKENASVWPGAVLRGDNDFITVGENSNIQDGAVLHADSGYPLTIGKDVTVGHLAMLHGCTIEDNALIGIAAVVLNGAVIGAWSLVGAGAFVPEGKKMDKAVLLLGSPAKKVRDIGLEDKAKMKAGILVYTQKAKKFKECLKRID